MSLATFVALIMFVGVIAYAVFGGADFGSGVWDLTAGDARRGGPMRSLIDDSIGPVWEANHTWLIFVLVYLWTGFPQAFAAICETLFIPLTLAGFGIVLRGSAFAFRKVAPTVAKARLFGAFFATGSVLTPFFFGAVAGAVASGRVPLDGSGDRWQSWTTEASLVGGVLAVLTSAYLAAVFLTAEATSQGNAQLAAGCRRRALGAGVLTGFAAVVGIVPLHDDAPLLFDRLTGPALPVVLLSAVGGAVSLLLLWRRRARTARIAAVVAVASVVAGWGFAQYPWVLVDAGKIDEIAAADATLWSLVVVFGLVAVTVVPALLYLYWLTDRSIGGGAR
ncbi:MAG TPA: cytochrome d ubiquinol oxidase subunit II [Ilumatobacteraceae bacterium]|nr:cytochrome d ubiquinol oxidase subunit II [Ilumatobacteraceae bacterium]